MPEVVITEEPEENEEPSRFASRHPDLTYVFGPAVKASYVVGCLVLDLFTPLQILDLLPGQPLWAVPPLVLGFGGLAFLEYRLYRRLWPPRTSRAIVQE